MAGRQRRRAQPAGCCYCATLLSLFRGSVWRRLRPCGGGALSPPFSSSDDDDRGRGAPARWPGVLRRLQLLHAIIIGMQLVLRHCSHRHCFLLLSNTTQLRQEGQKGKRAGAEAFGDSAAEQRHREFLDTHPAPWCTQNVEDTNYSILRTLSSRHPQTGRVTALQLRVAACAQLRRDSSQGSAGVAAGPRMSLSHRLGIFVVFLTLCGVSAAENHL